MSNSLHDARSKFHHTEEEEYPEETERKSPDNQEL